MTARLRPSEGRVPPHNLDAEAAVLSAALLHEEAAHALVDLIEPKDFYSDANARICAALLELVRTDRKTDAVTVASLLREQGRLEQVGGTPYLGLLADATPAVSNQAEHARIVRDLARVRNAIAAFQQLAAEGYEKLDNVQQWLDKAESTTYLATASRDDLLEAKIYRDAVTDVYNDTLTPTEQGHYVCTGFRALDQHLAGLAAGDLIYLGGRPGMGKTALVMDWAEHAALWGGVVVFSLEMQRNQLVQRSISRQAKIFYKRLRLKTLAQDEWERYAAALGPLGKLPIIVDDNPVLSPAKLKSRLRRHAATIKRLFGKELVLVVIDYVQLMDCDGDYGGNRNLELGEISRALKRAAKQFGCCVIALSQLSRPPKDAKIKPPVLSDLRESGNLEQDADNVIFIHRPDKYRPIGERDGKAEIIVAKGRNCGETVVESTFDGRYTQFTEVADQVVEAS